MNLKEEIEKTDWNFLGQNTCHRAHTIHPFPAKFVPQIPRKILSLVEVPEGTVVLDPFVGSGTTVLEAKLIGKNFVGIDINPIAVLISKVKTSPLPKESLKIALDIADSAKEKYKSNIKIALPDIPRLDHWFKEEHARALKCLTESISELNIDSKIFNYLRVCLSSILIKISNQESDTRYAAVAKQNKIDVFEQFKNSAESIANKLIDQRTLSTTKLGQGVIYCHDSRMISQLTLPRISLIITSPPYPNAYEYWLYNKYRMYWLGFDPIAVREKEIGARHHYSRPEGKSIDDFTHDLVQFFEGVKKNLVQGAYIFQVVGSYCKIRGMVYNTPAILQNSLEKIGFSPIATITRSIPRTRKTFNPQIGSIESETLMVLQWEGDA